MKVYYLTETAFPKGFAATNRIICTSKSIIQSGLECNVIAYKRTESANNIRNKDIVGCFESVPFRYIGSTNVYHKNIIIRNVIALTDYIKALLFLYRNIRKGDIVILYHVYLVFAPLVICICHLKGVKFITDVCEIPYGVVEPETKSMRIKRKLLLSYIYPHIDGFLSISKNLSNLILPHLGKTGSILRLPILVDYEKYCIQDLSGEISSPYIFHAGKLEEQKDGFLSIVKAFAIACKNPEFKVNYISTGNVTSSPQSSEIQRIISENNLSKRFKFVGYLDQIQLNDYLSKASFVIINKKQNQQNEYCFSTKLGEYMAAGKAVITTDIGEATNWLEDKRDSIIIEHDNIQALADAMVEMATNRELREQISQGAQKTCKENFDFKAHSNSIKYFMSHLYT